MVPGIRGDTQGWKGGGWDKKKKPRAEPITQPTQPTYLRDVEVLTLMLVNHSCLSYQKRVNLIQLEGRFLEYNWTIL